MFHSIMIEKVGRNFISTRITPGAVVAADGLDGVLPAAEGGGAPGGVAAGGEGLAARLEQVGGGLRGRARGRRPGRRGGPRPGRSIRPAGCAGAARPRRSAWNWRNGSERAMPPSTRRSVRGSGRSAFIASIRSATWKATPSRVARARSATRGGAGQAEDRAAGLGLPVGGAQAGQGGDEEDARVGVGVEAEAVDLGGRADGLQAVAEPLHGRPGDEDAPLEGVLRRAVAEGGRQGRDQAPRRGDDASPPVWTSRKAPVP